MSTKIALTFDVEREGVCSKAFRIPLEILEQHRVKATFFVLGRFAKRNPLVVKEIFSGNHEVGCHGYSHFPPYDERAIADVKKEVEKGTREVRKICDIQSFRSPYFRPHRSLPLMLENLGYNCDSSISSRRFDFFIGRTTNPRNLLCPLRPYHPKRSDIFAKGDSRIVEVPLSGLILPLSGVSLRTFGLTLFLRLAEAITHISDCLVFDCHTWEFGPPTDMKSRHRYRTGKETELMFKSLLEYLKRKGKFVTLSDLCGSLSVKT
jgi:peptidoglycan/xylan/chitin deacetylase (PgdA/CDA1 family)